jgi:hypothetical protein
MLTVFFDHEVLHIINMLEEQIINQHFYLEVLRCLRGACMMNRRKSVNLASSKFTMTTHSQAVRTERSRENMDSVFYNT